MRGQTYLDEGQCGVRRTCMRVKEGSVRGQTYLYEGQGRVSRGDLVDGHGGNDSDLGHHDHPADHVTPEGQRERAVVSPLEL